MCFIPLTDVGGSTTQQVAFTAFNFNNNYYSSGSKITFDSVETSIGGHFDKSSTFTCPVDGLYFFTFNIMSYSSYDPIIQLRKDGALVVSAFADVYSGTQYVHASNTALILCDAGEEVYLVDFSDVAQAKMYEQLQMINM